MTKELCTILKNDIAGLPFIFDLAGLVQTLSVDSIDNEGVKSTARFPVSHDTNITDNCAYGPERRLDPDSSRKSITYFEDFGTLPGERRGGFYTYRSTVRLVSWLNRSLLVGNDYAQISGLCISKLIATLCPSANPRNVGMFTGLKVTPGRVLPQDASIFSRYTYEETQRQYLRPPFEFFAIDLVADYSIHDKCLPEIQFSQKNCY